MLDAGSCSSVNLSGKSICDPRLASGIEEALDRTAIDPGRLIFELTETAAIGHIEQARTFANRLRRRGCQFALDDFGAGFGSFYYLKNFPFDYIKIDGGFIRELTSNPMDQLVVQAIVSIAQGLAKKTVAEFVGDQETSSQLRKARRRLRTGLLHRGTAAYHGGSRDRVTPHVIASRLRTLPGQKAR